MAIIILPFSPVRAEIKVPGCIVWKTKGLQRKKYRLWIWHPLPPTFCGRERFLQLGNLTIYIHTNITYIHTYIHAYIIQHTHMHADTSKTHPLDFKKDWIKCYLSGHEHWTYVHPLQTPESLGSQQSIRNCKVFNQELETHVCFENILA